MQKTNIEWTDFSANPLKYRDSNGKIVWGCVHASPGCQKCYSETLSKRYGRGGPFNAATVAGLTPFLDKKEMRSMLTNKAASGKMCFVGDMTDIFGEWVPDELLNQLFSNVLELRTDVTFQILTKRAERARQYLTWRWGEGRIPMRNIWIGVSAENQKTADARIPLLLQTPAAVRFVSYEPALGPVNFDGFLPWSSKQFNCGPVLQPHLETLPDLQGINGLIVGGEFGPGARSFNVTWARSVIEQCRNSNVPVFVKQLGSNIVGRNDDGFDASWHDHEGTAWPGGTRVVDLDTGYQGAPVRIRLKHSKGSDMSEWPEDLRVRQLPQRRGR